MKFKKLKYKLFWLCMRNKTTFALCYSPSNMLSTVMVINEDSVPE